MYHSFRYIHVITSRKISIKVNVTTKAIAEMKPVTEQTMKLKRRD